MGQPSDTHGVAPAVTTDSDFNRELSVEQLSPKVRSILGLPDKSIGAEAFGSGSHPFTTERVSVENGIEPVNSYPWRATGKLSMTFGPQRFVCSASVIGRSLLVTAAHCVHNFGKGKEGFASSVSFEPARHDDARPFGTWTAKAWFIPKTYFDGSDVCSNGAPGVVCENDIAVVVLNQNGDKAIADVVGMYNLPPEPNEDEVPPHEFGFTFFLGQKSAHFTQLGYPSMDYDGTKMIRTDSLGYQDDPNNVIIGSNQTGGSSGCPWLQNFGTPTSYTGTPPFDSQLNTVTAVTSWGFTTSHIKVQGASRFAKNHAYTKKTNIRSLVDEACGADPGAC
ncbi:trypsin-like serine protease [Mesorhizobium sp. M0106]|uniref:trypsin-like serine peptidase n=1 Tax=Mesorhizobium sp. M0106 TaxID=2956880 RepID=UPI00333B8B90